MNENQQSPQATGRMITLMAEWTLELFAGDPSGLSLKEALALEIVGSRKFVRMTDLAGLLHLPVTTATSLVDRLAGQGLFKRSRFEDERRIVAVSLTPESQGLWEKQRSRQIAWLKGMLGRLSESEQAQLLVLIEKMGSRITQNTPT